MELLAPPTDRRNARRHATPEVVLLVGSEQTMGRWERAVAAAGYAPVPTQVADEGLRLLTRCRP